ncbi:MAG: outer membrane protein transport protein [Candidatus Lernaella stagnicola]|nr:outer membrane protein transport protein [Candidatus Lernaella stagnicola]
MKRIVFWCCLLVAVFALSPGAWAGVGGAPFAYGFGARGISMGMAYTALENDVSTAYFNPAAMARIPTSEMAFTYLYAQPEFQGGPKGDTFAFDQSNRVLQFNWVTKLNELLKSRRDIAVGLNVSLDDNGAAFIRFYDVQNSDGYYYFYGPHGFTLNFTVGFGVTDWLFLGGGVVTTLHGISTFEMKTDLAGKTSEEGTTLDSDVVFAPITSVLFHLDMVDIALTWHGRTWGQFQPIEVKAAAEVGKNELAELPMKLYFKDNYIPHRVGLGTYWRPTDWMNISADVVWHNWADFTDLIDMDDLPRDNVDLEMKDIFVPHLGLEFEAYNHFFTRAGYSFQPSPVVDGGSDFNMMLDNDKHIATAGLGYNWQNPPLLTYPVSFDAAYFFEYLMDREFETEGQKYESSGFLNGMAATLTVRY